MVIMYSELQRTMEEMVRLMSEILEENHEKLQLK
jgi:hypothetical protein